MPWYIHIWYTYQTPNFADLHPLLLCTYAAYVMPYKVTRGAPGITHSRKMTVTSHRMTNTCTKNQASEEAATIDIKSNAVPRQPDSSTHSSSAPHQKLMVPLVEPYSLQHTTWAIMLDSRISYVQLCCGFYTVCAMLLENRSLCFWYGPTPVFLCNTSSYVLFSIHQPAAVRCTLLEQSHGSNHWIHDSY